MNPVPVLVAARRTPIGTAGHGFAALTVADLAAPVLESAVSALREAGIYEGIDDVVLGNCLGPGGDLARVAALRAGLGVEVPGVTVDRQCGSGLDAVMQAALRVRSGVDELILAGGAESASTAPWRYWPPTPAPTPCGTPARRSRPPDFPTPIWVSPPTTSHECAVSAGSDRTSTRPAPTLAAAADFTAEIVPVGAVARDARVRPGMTAARLARLRPSFGAAGTATAGNSCGISDGAAVVAVTTEDRAAGLPALRIVGSAVAGSDPALPGLGPVPAIRSVLRRAGRRVADLEVVEITEAFASVVLAVADELELDESLICPEGGAIAMGHPWGASGAVLLVRLASQMLRPGGPSLGLAACAIGGGQGIAVLVERVA